MEQNIFFPNATLATLEKPCQSLTESVPFYPVFLSHKLQADGGLLGAQGASLQLPCTPEAACRNAHAPLCTLSPLAVKLRLALSALRTAPVAGGSGRGGGGRLGGDGTQQVVAFAQEVATGTQTEASLTQSHTCAACLGRSRALTVLQM